MCGGEPLVLLGRGIREPEAEDHPARTHDLGSLGVLENGDGMSAQAEDRGIPCRRKASERQEHDGKPGHDDRREEYVRRTRTLGAPRDQPSPSIGVFAAMASGAGSTW